MSKVFVSEVKIEIVKPGNGLIGFASVVIDNAIYLGSIAVYKKLNSEGYRVLYPKKGAFDMFDFVDLGSPNHKRSLKSNRRGNF